MRFALTLTLLFAVGTAGAQADPGNERPQSAPQMTVDPQATAFGHPGNAKDVTRDIHLSLRDTMSIVPDRLNLVQGETVRLRIKNIGRIPHEFVLGTRKEILEHRDMMRKMPTMQAAEANDVSVSPGETSEIIWRFSNLGSFEYACLVPGHWEAGMQGVVTVTARPSRERPAKPR